MAVNLNKQNKNRVNLLKGSPDRRGKINLTKTPVQGGDGKTDSSASNGNLAGTSAGGGYSSQTGNLSSGRKFRPWFFIPIAAVLLIFVVVAIGRSIKSDDTDAMSADKDLQADSNMGEAGQIDNNMQYEEPVAEPGEDADKSQADAEDGTLIAEENTDKEADKVSDEVSNKESDGVSDEVSNKESNKESDEGIAMVTDNHIDDTTIHNYEIITADVTWEEAFNDCIERGGYLCRINSEEENEKIKSLLNENDVRGVVYLGGLRDLDSDEYHWIDDERLPFDEVINQGDFLKYWLDGEPSFKDHVYEEEIEERYMAIIYPGSEKDWVWNDVSNDILSLAPGYYTGRLSYICEYDINLN